MSLQRFIPALLLMLIVSVTVMIHASGRDQRPLTELAAGAFVALIIVVALRINIPAWLRPADREASVGLMRRNTRLAALIYAWGAAAMLGIYSLTGLSWRHGWQYGMGMALVAAGLALFVRQLGRQPVMPPIILTVLHGAFALCGLAYLISAGKLATNKGDWAANDIFLYGGLGILLLNGIAAITQLRSPQR